MIKKCDEWIERIQDSNLTKDDANVLRDELLLALRLNVFSARRCLGLELGDSHELIRQQYRYCWTVRSRGGGLEDSLDKLTGLLA